MQWNIILLLAFTLVIAAVAVVNIDTVTINYLFGEASVPLILIIIGSTLAGALIIVFFNLAKQISQYRKIKHLEHEIERLQAVIEDYQQRYGQGDVLTDDQNSQEQAEAITSINPDKSAERDHISFDDDEDWDKSEREQKREKE